MTWNILEGDALTNLREMPDGVIQCCVTSPPYWGLRDYGAEGQLGLEPTPEEYVERMVEVFREVRRVLRDDGTLWLNLGDSYSRNGSAPPRPDHSGTTLLGTYGQQGSSAAAQSPYRSIPPHLKEKDLCGMPWRVAFALQADGWYLRSDIIWAKPNPMPESVTDRPTKSHEYLFLMSKSARYFYDAEAIREENVTDHDGNVFGGVNKHEGYGTRLHRGRVYERTPGRNKRDVWTVPTQPFPGAHFAVMPPNLVLPCVKAGTSEHGCCSACGAPWTRQLEREPMEIRRSTRRAEMGRFGQTATSGKMVRPATSKTIGWEPACMCDGGRSPCVVLDPFSGAGTVGVVATRQKRSYVGIELNPEYAEMSRRRIEGDAPLFNREEA